MSKAELSWREWFLGEGRFKSTGPRDPSLRNQTGAPTKIPADWWKRLEAFLVKRADYAESGSRPDPATPKPTPGDRGQLTPHFHVREFDCHDGRKVPPVAIPALKRLCVKILEPMRAQFGPGHVLSGYRPSDYNARIGGARFSQHIYDLTPDSVAADTTWRLGNPAAWAAFADHLGAGGVGRYDQAGFVHTDNRPGRARWTG